MPTVQGSADGELKHMAIIMDGNNRWAREQNLKGLAGHRAGADRLKKIVESCSSYGIDVLSVFAFSSENWSRPKQEVRGLLSLFSASLKRYKSELKSQNIALKVIGRRDRFSAALQKQIRQVEDETAGGTRTLVIAADYGGRWDVAQAASALAQKVAQGRMSTDEINEASMAQELSLAAFPPVDLLVRTGGEKRISNFFLWQIAYAELFFANCYWPDFDETWLERAVNEFKQRQRRYGGNPEPIEFEQANGSTETSC